jgi:hypothetical protein
MHDFGLYSWRSKQEPEDRNGKTGRPPVSFDRNAALLGSTVALTANIAAASRTLIEWHRASITVAVAMKRRHDLLVRAWRSASASLAAPIDSYFL